MKQRGSIPSKQVNHVKFFKLLIEITPRALQLLWGHLSVKIRAQIVLWLYFLYNVHFLLWRITKQVRDLTWVCTGCFFSQNNVYNVITVQIYFILFHCLVGLVKLTWTKGISLCGQYFLSIYEKENSQSSFDHQGTKCYNVYNVYYNRIINFTVTLDQRKILCSGPQAKWSSGESDTEQSSHLHFVLRQLSLPKQTILSRFIHPVPILTQQHLPINYQWQSVAQGTRLPLCAPLGCQALRGL